MSVIKSKLVSTKGFWTHFLCFQLVFFIIVRPFSRSLYRRINKNVAELLWLQLIWLFDWWACIKVGDFHESCCGLHRGIIVWYVIRLVVAADQFIRRCRDSRVNW